MSKFEFGADKGTTQSPTSYSAYSDSDNEDNLPYPGELPRKDFLNPDFNPQTYLSTLRNRHQTLEDLRTDLRQRSQLLNQELLDLVNNNYEQFLSLGADLKGGEEKVEGVRVGLLGYEREVEAIRKSVRERREDVGRLLDERKEVRLEVVLGRGLLEVENSIRELEERLKITKGEDASDVEDLSESEDEEVENDQAQNGGRSLISVKRQQRHTEQFILLTRLIARLGPSHPFLQAQESRVEILKRTLLLDLRTAMQQAKAASSSDAILALMQLHAALDSDREGPKLLAAG